MVSIVRRSLMTPVAVTVGVLLLVLIVLTVAAWAFQEKIAFQPESPPFPQPDAAAQLEYTASDGQHLFAYVIGNPRIAKGVLLAFHGNADLSVRQIGWAREIERRTGIAVVLPEYRGYMGLEGKPTYRGSQLDAEAAYSFVRSTFDIPGDRFVFYGHSLGSAIAVELALVHRPRNLILEAPFTSARDMAALVGGEWFTAGLWPVISRLHFDTSGAVASLDIPVSVTHGGRDRVIPFRMGQAVYSAARNKDEWLFVPDAAHNNVRDVGGERYWEWLTRSLRHIETGDKKRPG